MGRIIEVGDKTMKITRVKITLKCYLREKYEKERTWIGQWMTS